ncbi:MAG: nuclear transport factor 2 family protein [Comamonas sp.]|uniref:nuclear transport factor 2 family protein n=1 Tax=Comamonas sp. TaxID=34028 RepID=UPI002FCA27AA
MTQGTDLIANALKTKHPKDVLQAFLVNSGKETVKHAAEALVAEDAVYISLNFENPELEQIEPWTGTRKGRQIYIDTFSNVGTYWEVNDFQITDLISEGETVAVFGQFTYTSVEIGHRFTSPLAIKATVKDGLITFFQFMEDTYASARSFRKSGSWEIQNNGRTITVG